MDVDTILHGDALSMLRTLSDNSVHCCVTSPPYFGLRDYGVAGQIGLEGSVEEYVARLVDVFAEVRRVLRNDGTCWLNLGDSYCTRSVQRADGMRSVIKDYAGDADLPKWKDYAANGNARYSSRMKSSGLKDKDLIGVPWRVAFALQAAGWWLRSDIIWAKKNCMPESVTDRPTRSHEYIFLLAKSERYYYNAAAIREPLAAKTYTTFGTEHRAQGNDALGGVKSDNWGRTVGTRKPKVWDDSVVRVAYRQRGHSRRHAGFNDRWDHMTKEQQQALGANKRDVWHVAPKPFHGAHFATFPPKLIEPCIIAGCPAGGVVLDPFFGSGTVGEVAIRHSRHYIGIELNAAYIQLAEERLGKGIQRVLWSAS